MGAKRDQEVPERTASWNRLELFCNVEIGEFLQIPN